MQVFTPAQSKSATQERTAKDALRAKNLAEITEEILREQKQADLSFQESMARKRKEAAEFDELQVARKNELKREVEELEERKKRALMPLTERENAISSKEASLRSWETSLEDKEDEHEEKYRLLMLRLDDVSTREQEVENKERRANRLLAGAELQQKQVAEGARLLNVQIGEFRQYTANEEEKYHAIALGLDAREALYDEKDKSLVKREQKVKEDSIVIRQRLIELEKGFEILRKQQNGNRLS